jgi:hypothetical protein
MKRNKRIEEWERPTRATNETAYAIGAGVLLAPIVLAFVILAAEAFRAPWELTREEGK